MSKKVINPFQKSHNRPFIVAELSGNHGQSLQKAKKLVNEIAKTGAHAIKLQTYKPETMTFNIKNKNFMIKNKKIYGKVVIFMIFIKKLTRLGNGIEKFLN